MSYAALTTLAAVKAWIKQPAGTADDGNLSSLITTCSELIGRYCSRENLGEVIAYTEPYFPGRGAMMSRSMWNLVARHYPVVALNSVLINTTVVPILSLADLQAGKSGVFLELAPEPRVLKFCQVAGAVEPLVLTVSYTAGYATPPAGLAQVCNQFVVEVLRANANVGLRSLAMAGETTSFDMGTDIAMSARVKAMLLPYKDHCSGLGMR